MAKPPFEITTPIFDLCLKIADLLGKLNSAELTKPALELRRANKIQSIHSSLVIEGNSLSLEQATAFIHHHPIRGPHKDILELKNAVAVYEKIADFHYPSISDFQRAHKLLMKDLIKDNGKWRLADIGTFAGSKVTHMAPSYKRVSLLMKNCFAFLKTKEALLIKACVFHYELTFIHPFSDGNGRMARFWQQVILRHYDPLFEFLPVEKLIKANQKKYYLVLSLCDEAGNSTAFIHFMLNLIYHALIEYDQLFYSRRLNKNSRIEKAKTHFKQRWFARQNYLELNKSISAVTASRDLKEAVTKKQLEKKGDKRLTEYRFRI